MSDRFARLEAAACPRPEQAPLVNTLRRSSKDQAISQPLNRPPIELGSLGLFSENMERADLIHEKDDCRVYRIEVEGQSYVLKWIGRPEDVEVRSYRLLERLGDRRSQSTD